MTIRDINDIIQAVCLNDEDYEKPCISPKYLRQKLEMLALEQEQRMLKPTTKNDLGVDCISREQALNELKQHLFELSYALDSKSSGKDYVALRRTLYDNQIWIHDNGLQEEYYKYFYSKFKEEGALKGINHEDD